MRKKKLKSLLEWYKNLYMSSCIRQADLETQIAEEKERYRLRFGRICPVSEAECVCGGYISRSYNFCPHCGRALDFSSYNEIRFNEAFEEITKANKILTGGVADD